MSLTPRATADVKKAFKFDPSPMFACDVKPHPTIPGASVILSWMAFDPRYGPESDRQIEWHQQYGTPGADDWEVGEPVSTPSVHP